jgi:hypothetical protein
VNWFGKHGRKVSWIVKRFVKCKRKKVKRYGKYGRKYWNDLENIKVRQVEWWKDLENTEEK